MEPLIQLTTTAIPFLTDEIDTDQIIPARYLKATNRDGFGKNLFRDWRFIGDEVQNPEFVLNKTEFSGKLMLCGKNFGCGSSREHAAWALYDYGFRVLISEQFADIFKNNALNNGLLPIELSSNEMEVLSLAVQRDPALSFLIDVVDQTVVVKEIGFESSFEINPYRKHCLMNGFDDIDYLLSIEKA